MLIECCATCPLHCLQCLKPSNTHRRAQKMSLWSWALGSVCTVVSECYELLQLSKPPSTGEGKEAWDIKRMKAQAEINTRLITLVHALFQVRTSLTCKCTAIRLA